MNIVCCELYAHVQEKERRGYRAGKKELVEERRKKEERLSSDSKTAKD